MKMKGVYAFGIFLGFTLAAIGAIFYVVAAGVGDSAGQLVAAVDVVAGGAFVVRNIIAQRQEEREQVASERRFREAASSPPAPSTPGTSQRILVHCPFCGAYGHPDVARYCHQCGKPLPELASSPGSY